MEPIQTDLTETTTEPSTSALVLAAVDRRRG